MRAERLKLKGGRLNKEERKRRAKFVRDSKAEGEMKQGEKKEDLSRTKWAMKGEI